MCLPKTLCPGCSDSCLTYGFVPKLRSWLCGIGWRGVASYGFSSRAKLTARRNGHQLGRGESSLTFFLVAPATRRSLQNGRSHHIL